MAKVDSLVKAIVDLGESSDKDCSESIARIVRPNPDFDSSAHEPPSAKIRNGREALAAVFAGVLVSDELSKVLGSSGATREQIDSLLNQPFPPTKAITVDYLDLQAARIQRLEACCRLLIGVLTAMAFPDRSPADYVSISSAVRRRA